MEGEEGWGRGEKVEEIVNSRMNVVQDRVVRRSGVNDPVC